MAKKKAAPKKTTKKAAPKKTKKEELTGYEDLTIANRRAWCGTAAIMRRNALKRMGGNGYNPNECW